jgi:glycosyltransferase involved in cell wall biosynthesis
MGTRGVPAQHGGFETAVEEIGRRLVQRGYEVTVYCRNPGQQITEYEGMRLINVPAIRNRFAETLNHTALSSAHAIIKDRPDVCLLLNAGNAPLLPALHAARIPTAIHLDGLESRREKWRGAGARYYKWAEKVAVKNGTAVIADAQGIADHIEREYGRRCVVISYGADIIYPESNRLSEVGVVARDYHLVVARLEPENHVLEAVHAYRVSEETRPLVVVGSTPYSQWYADKVHEAAQGSPLIKFTGPIYDRELLDQLYGHARTYIHGHSVGGTNPSLLRAMGAGAPVLAFDCEFNREVTANNAFFWSDADQLTVLFDDVASGEDEFTHESMDLELRRFADACRTRIAEHYQWDQITDQYEVLIEKLAKQRGAGRRKAFA